MTFSLEFQKRLKYDSLAPGISVEAVLRRANFETTCLAKIDTGLEVGLFERGVGEALEIEIESVTPRRFSTLTGVFQAYAHEVVLETLGFELQTVVYFAESYQVHRNILGRHGWLQLLRLGVVDYDSELYLSLYNE